MARRNGDDFARGEAEAGKLFHDRGFDVAESAFLKADAVHLVDDDGDLSNAEEMQQIAVPARLLLHALGHIDDQHGGVGLGSAGDHVAQEFGVAGGVDENDIAQSGSETDLAGVERDALVAFGLQRVEQKRPFEVLAAPAAHRLERRKLAVRKAVGLVQQPSDQCRFSVIDVPDHHDANQRAGVLL
jgi:hypothetical protein